MKCLLHFFMALSSSSLLTSSTHLRSNRLSAEGDFSILFPDNAAIVVPFKGLVKVFYPPPLLLYARGLGYKARATQFPLTSALRSSYFR